MVMLDPYNRSRCYLHLGYGSGSGIPAGDITDLEDAMNKIRDNHHAMIVTALLDTCDADFEAYLAGQSKRSEELIAGDINRSVQRTIDPTRAKDVAWQDYLNTTDRLAQFLWVPNYWREDMMRWRFERGGGERFESAPGVADTTIGGAQYEIANNGGGFGMPAY